MRIGSRVVTGTGRRGKIRFIGDLSISGDSGKASPSFFQRRVWVEWDDRKGLVFGHDEQELNELIQGPDSNSSNMDPVTSTEPESTSQIPNSSQGSCPLDTRDLQEGQLQKEQSQKEQGQPDQGHPGVQEAQEPMVSSDLEEPVLDSYDPIFKMPEYTYCEKEEYMFGERGLINTRSEGLRKDLVERCSHFQVSTDYIEKICLRDCPPIQKAEDRLFYINRIKNILRDNRIGRKSGGQRSGELHFKKLWKIQTSDRIFQKERIVSDKEYNVALLIDCSGSMRGQRIIKAAQSAELFVKEFQHLCNISIGIFSTDYNLVMPFNKSNRKNIFSHEDGRKIAERIFLECNWHGGCTNEHTGLSAMIDSFRGLSGKNILISMCDGGPDSGDRVKKMVDKAQRLRISPVGFGIETNSVEHYYTNWVRVDNPKDIYPGLMECLGKTMIRAGST